MHFCPSVLTRAPISSGDHDALLRGGDIEDLRNPRAQALVAVIRPDAQKENAGPFLSRAPTIALVSSTSGYRHIKSGDETGHQGGGLKTELGTQQVAVDPELPERLGPIPFGEVHGDNGALGAFA